MSNGYANRVIHLPFPELAEPQLDAAGNPVLDAAGNPVPSEPIWVSIRNPRLVAPGEMAPDDVPVDPATGQPVSPRAANEAMFQIFAKLIIGMRAYDATDFSIDADGHPLPQRLLEAPFNTVDVVRKLPNMIINKIAEQMSVSANPS